jgi:hypothetical protein
VLSTPVQNHQILRLANLTFLIQVLLKMSRMLNYSLLLHITLGMFVYRNTCGMLTVLLPVDSIKLTLFNYLENHMTYRRSRVDIKCVSFLSTNLV